MTETELLQFFGTVSGVVVTVAGVFSTGFVLGWGARRWFHRREHDKLRATIVQLQKRLKDETVSADARVNEERLRGEAKVEAIEKRYRDLREIDRLSNAAVIGSPGNVQQGTQREPGLTQEQQIMLLGCHMGNQSGARKQLGKRASLVIDQLEDLGLMRRSGVQGPYVTKRGRAMLDELGLI